MHGGAGSLKAPLVTPARRYDFAHCDPYLFFQSHLREFTDCDRDQVCDGDLHFVPGHDIFGEMRTCIADSAVFVAVISENFCQSYFCQLEISEARSSGKPIILIFKEQVDEEQMDTVIREVFLKFARAKVTQTDGQYEISPKWEQICEAVLTLM